MPIGTIRDVNSQMRLDIQFRLCIPGKLRFLPSEVARSWFSSGLSGNLLLANSVIDVKTTNCSSEYKLQAVYGVIVAVRVQ